MSAKLHIPSRRPDTIVILFMLKILYKRAFWPRPLLWWAVNLKTNWMCFTIKLLYLFIIPFSMTSVLARVEVSDTLKLIKLGLVEGELCPLVSGHQVGHAPMTLTSSGVSAKGFATSLRGKCVWQVFQIGVSQKRSPRFFYSAAQADRQRQD